MDSTGSGTSAPPCASVRPSPGYQGHTSGHRRPQSQDDRSLPGRRHAETPRNARRVRHPGGILPLAHTAAPCDRSPRGGARAVPAPPGFKVARWNNATRQGALADPVAAAAGRLLRRCVSSCMRIWTGTAGAPATPTPGDHHLPPIPGAGPRGPAPNEHTSPPSSRQLSANDRQRFTRTPTRRRAKHPAHPPPPSQGQRPTHCREDHTPRTRDQRSLRRTQALRKERGGSPPRSPVAAKPQGHDASGPRADTEVTGTSGPQASPGPLLAVTPCLVPQQQEPSTEYVPGGHPDTTSRHPSPAGAKLDQDRVAMPPPPPRPLQQRGVGPFDDAELRALYGIHASMPSSELVATLGEHLRDVDPNGRFAVVPLPHAATTEIFVRQLQALVTPGTQVSDDLVAAWIWLFNTHQPAQGGVWVPHLGWVHTLIAPPTDPRPAPSTGGRERAAPPPRPDNLRIPPHKGLAAWESGTARSRGHNLTSLAARYPETTRMAPPPRERDHGTIAMIVLQNGHYYQVRIIPHSQRGHWSLEAVDFMLSATRDLPDSPTPLLPDQPLDRLTAVVSGTAGTWHPGHGLYCLLPSARRRWPHTRAWSAA